MFSASRIVAIDNEKSELDQLSTALHGLGIPCIPLAYPDQVEEATWLRSVRILFCDLHLLAGVKPELNFQVIGGLLERINADEALPPLLVLWTAYPEEGKNLEQYIRDRHPSGVPISILALKKEDFRGDKAGNLPGAIREQLQAIPQLAALYEWQNDVATAGDGCVGTLLKLARNRGGELKESLDTVLSSLAQAAHGKTLASECPANAIEDILLPLMQDRLSHIPHDNARQELWKNAMPSAVAGVDCRKKVPPASINTALHVVHPAAGTASGRERGATVRITCPSLFSFRFSESAEKIIEKWKLKDNPIRWMAIQVEAACDFAQQKSPCVPFVLAAEIPATSKTTNNSPAMWTSPAFMSENNQEVRLVANVLYTSTISTTKAKRLPVAYRLRDQLVNDLAFRKSQNEMRPGRVCLE